MGEPASATKTGNAEDDSRGSSEVDTCDAKNAAGTADCTPNASGRAKATKVAAPRDRFAGFTPDQCGQGAHLVGDAWAMMLTGKLKDWEDYCTMIESGQGQTVARTGGSSGTGGGCEYRGRNYGPGESVYSPIDSDSLLVFGQRFEELAGVSKKWQQCQCSSSSGHWGCV
ncbi:hypothetical protein [Pseudogemmobacter humi]|nr:hypothetical protein [Pseudogemmobacter humi]